MRREARGKEAEKKESKELGESKMKERQEREETRPVRNGEAKKHLTHLIPIYSAIKRAIS